MTGGARETGWGQGCGENCFTLDGDGFTCHRVLDEPEVWRVELLMHDTFLPSVNAFVVRDGAETLVVDSGTPDDFNDTRLMRALLGLGVDPECVTVFFTHAHIDHTGLARELAEAGGRLVVPEGVLADMRRFAVPAWREAMVARLRAEGLPPSEASELADVIWDHSRNFEAERIPFEAVPAGGALACGRWRFEVVPTPGHTPGSARSGSRAPARRFSATRCSSCAPRASASGMRARTRSASRSPRCGGSRAGALRTRSWATACRTASSRSGARRTRSITSGAAPARSRRSARSPVRRAVSWYRRWAGGSVPPTGQRRLRSRGGSSSPRASRTSTTSWR